MRCEVKQRNNIVKNLASRSCEINVCKTKIGGKNRYVNNKVRFVQSSFHQGNIFSTVLMHWHVFNYRSLFKRVSLFDFKDLNDISVQGDQIYKGLEKNYFLNADQISRQVNVADVLVELDFTQNKFVMLFSDQNDHSYLINCLTGDVPSNGSKFFITCVCITIIPFENHVYLFDSHSRDVFGMPNENGFFICINFPNYKSVVTYIYNLFVNYPQVQFENQFINGIISGFFNEAIPVSLIDSEDLSKDEKNSGDKKEELDVGIKCHELQSIDLTCRSKKYYASNIANFKALISKGPTFFFAVCSRCLHRTNFKKVNKKIYSDLFLSVYTGIVSSDKNYYICLTCHKSLKKHNIFHANNLFLAEMPNEISALNILGKKLI